MQTIKSTVEVVKSCGVRSNYFVLACSLGGAETICLQQVYESRTALATEGWPLGVTHPDLITEAAAQMLWASHKE